MRALGGWFGRLSPSGRTEGLSGKKAAVREYTDPSYVEESVHWQVAEAPGPGGAASTDEGGAEALLNYGYADPVDEDLARRLIAGYPDVDTAYCWLGRHYGLRGRFDEARAVLDEGLAACRRKRRLCRDYGWLELEANRLPEAVKWWLRAATLQANERSYDDHEPFLYLAHVAGRCGLAEPAQRLFAVVDAIRPSRLSTEGQAELRTLVEKTNQRPLVEAIEAFTQRLADT